MFAVFTFGVAISVADFAFSKRRLLIATFLRTAYAFMIRLTGASSRNVF